MSNQRITKYPTLAPIDTIHKWNGAIATLIKIDKIVIVNMGPTLDKLVIINVNKNITEEKAWILKYLIIAFEEDSFISWNSQINPTNLNKFNSIMNQIVSKE